MRLLPPSDPLLQGRDRDLLVPDRAHQKALWRALQSPGALLVNGEITGTWRAKLAGKRRLDVEVRPFSSLAPADRAKIGEQAQRVAAVRGVAEAGSDTRAHRMAADQGGLPTRADRPLPRLRGARLQ